ncbi:hypothetical protein HZS_4965 [Henneguya salminicola]|nr:hypothetical protein HZS_4965 [Henneguya salminicola]
MEYIINNKIACKCNRGYKGKYCKNSICQNDCNGNGYCVGRGACVCNSIYKGKLCDEYLCSENTVNPCVNGGICFQANNSIKCQCPFVYIYGKFCQILSCGKKCKNGKCIFSINYGTYKCVCTGHWYGPSCGIQFIIILGLLDVDHLTRRQYIVIVPSNILLASIDITFLIVIAYIYRKLNIANNC